MLAVLSVVALVLFVVIWKLPVPKHFSKPIILRILLVVMMIVQSVGNVLIWLGIQTRAGQLKSYAKSKKLTAKDTKGLRVVETDFEGVKVKVFQQSEECPSSRGYPGVVFYHGGGWVIGNSSTYDTVVARIARKAQAVVVSVDYRLAPEHVFPAPFQDCLTATKYFLQHATDFGADPEKVAIMGDSAGGNLAAGVAIQLREDRFQPAVKRQVLIYPVLQASDLCTPSMLHNSQGPFLSRELVAWFWSMYLCGTDDYVNDFLNNKHTSAMFKDKMRLHVLNMDKLEAKYVYKPASYRAESSTNDELWRTLKAKLSDPTLAPLMAEDLKGLPEACIITCQYDVLRDDGIFYAKSLEQAGVKVSLLNIEAGYHGLLTIISCEEREMLFAEVLRSLQEL